MIRFLALALLVAGSSACVPSIMVSAQKDRTYALNKDVPLYLALKGDVSVYEKNLHSQLQSALTQSGFRLTQDLSEAKVVMTFAMADEKNAYEVYDPWPPHHWHSRYYGYYSPFWPRYHPTRTYVSEQRSIKLRLFDANVFRAGDRWPLWEGVVTSDLSTLKARLHESLEVLVDKIGEDFQGQVQIK